MHLAERRSRPALTLATCCLSLFIVTLDATVVNVALPTLGKDLHATVSSLQWTLDAYTLTLASLLVLAGSSGDRFGRRKVFRIGLVVFGVGSILCSAAPSDGFLIASRVLQAIGGSMLNPVSLSIITNVYTDPKARARALGVWGAVSGLSLGLGPLIGGLLVQSVGWRSIFLINVPVVVLALVLTAIFVPESKSDQPRRFDPVGQVLVIVALAGVVFGIIEGPGLGWGSPGTIAAFVIAAAALGAFVPYELHRKEPLIDPRYFLSIPFAGAFVAALVAFGGWSAFLFANTLMLQDVRDFSPAITGLLFMPAGIGLLITSPIAGRMVGSIGTRLPMCISGITVAVAAAVLAFTTATTPVVLLVAVFLVFGAGFGFVNSPITNTAVAGMPTDQAGGASAIASTARQVGVALGVALAGSITGASSGSSVSKAFAVDAHPLWWVVAGTGVVVVVVGVVSNTASATQSSKKLGPLLGDAAHA